MAIKRRSFAHARKVAGHTQESLAERLDVDRSTVARWEAGEFEPQPWQRPRISEALGLSLCEVNQLIDERERTERATGKPASLARGGGARLAGHEQVQAAARESLAFVRWAETSNVSASDLDHLTGEIGRIAVSYVHTPLLPLFGDLVGLRSLAFELLETGRQHPQQARELFFLAGTSCLLLAHASQNLGHSASAIAQVRTALTCAEQADHHGLQAWTHGTAALIAEWTHQHRRAVESAQHGEQFAPTAESRVRLASLEARAAARTGDRALTLDALERARRARDGAAGHDQLEEFGGVLSFPLCKQHYYAGSAYMLLGDAGSAQDYALLAIRMYETGPVEQRSYGDEALARVDVTTARLALSDLDGAREALRPVLGLAPECRIEQIAVGLGRVRSALATPQFVRVPLAREITQELDQYQAESVAHSLLLTQ